MANKIVQLQNKTGTDNLYPIAGGTTANTVTKGMMAEGIFEGVDLSTPSDVAFVATDNIQDGAVTYDKMDYSNMAPAYAAKTWNRGSISSDQGDSAIAGDYTVDTKIITLKITPRKTGVIQVFVNMPMLGTGGTAYVEIYIDGTQKRRMATPSASAIAVFSTVGTYTDLVSAGVEHTIDIWLRKNNTTKMTVYGYSPIEATVVELG